MSSDMESQVVIDQENNVVIEKFSEKMKICVALLMMNLISMSWFMTQGLVV
ncbi:hypothetical protein CASFOL_020687 [Castilleja foliolosa]|uniref:Uncharacterized protein n=1 Tax=Castilleja foliolosa TaxID=1961234 RepID=A0ABD3D1J7_9LAMI